MAIRVSGNRKLGNEALHCRCHSRIRHLRVRPIEECIGNILRVSTRRYAKLIDVCSVMIGLAESGLLAVDYELACEQVGAVGLCGVWSRAIRWRIQSSHNERKSIRSDLRNIGLVVGCEIEVTGVSEILWGENAALNGY